MIYLNTFKQLTDDAVDSLYGLVKDLINKNTTNILEVGTYAGQVTVRLCKAAAEKNSAVNVISIDENYDTFSPTAEESLKENNLNNYSIHFGDLAQRFENNIIKASIIYIDRFHNEINTKLELIKRNVIVPTKVIFRNPKNAGNYPFDVTEFKPEVKPRARKKNIAEKEEVKDTTENKKTTP